MRLRRQAALGLLAILGVCALSYLRSLAFGEMLALRDHLFFTLPARDFLASAIRGGHFPEWWDGVGLGMAFAGNPGYLATYPPAWLHALFPMPFAVDFVLLLHVAWMAVGQALLARRWGAGTWGSVLAGGLLATAGYVASVSVNGVPIPTLAWTPWVAWAADRLAQRTQLRPAVVVAMLFGAQIMSGDPAGVVTSALLAGLIVLARAERRGRAIGALMAAFVGGAVLAAGTILPAAATLAGSERAHGLSLVHSGTWSMHPLRIFELIWPRLYGDPFDDSHSLRWLLRQPGETELDATWSFSVYLGAPAILLALLAQKRRLFLCSLLFVLLALGTYTPLYSAYRAVFLPERLIRYPEKHIAGALVVWSALAGVGLTRMFDGKPSRKIILSCGVIAGLFGIAVLALLGRVPRETVDGGLAALGVMALLGASLLLRAHTGLHRFSLALAICTLLGHAVLHDWSIEVHVPRELVSVPPPLLARVAAEGQGAVHPRLYRPRILPPSLPARSLAEKIVADRYSARPNSATPFGFAYVPGYDPSLPVRLANVWTAARHAGNLRVLDLFDVAYAILPSTMRPAHFTPIAATPSNLVTLYRNEGRRPRAFVTSRFRWEPDDAAATQHLFDSNRPLLLAGSGPPSDGPVDQPCRLVYARPERVEMSCTAAAPAYAVLLDAHAPGWTATVDGKPARIERADVVARAVAIDAGTHTIEMSYRTPRLRTGAWVAAIAWLVALGLLGFARRAEP